MPTNIRTFMLIPVLCWGVSSVWAAPTATDDRAMACKLAYVLYTIVTPGKVLTPEMKSFLASDPYAELRNREAQQALKEAFGAAKKAITLKESNEAHSASYTVGQGYEALQNVCSHAGFQECKTSGQGAFALPELTGSLTACGEKMWNHTARPTGRPVGQRDTGTMVPGCLKEVTFKDGSTEVYNNWGYAYTGSEPGIHYIRDPEQLIEKDWYDIARTVKPSAVARIDFIELTASEKTILAKRSQQDILRNPRKATITFRDGTKYENVFFDPGGFTWEGPRERGDLLELKAITLWNPCEDGTQGARSVEQ